MNILPAIDIRGGKVVRLTKGDYDNMTVYRDSPAEVAEEFLAEASVRNHRVYYFSEEAEDLLREVEQ